MRVRVRPARRNCGAKVKPVEKYTIDNTWTSLSLSLSHTLFVFVLWYAFTILRSYFVCARAREPTPIKRSLWLRATLSRLLSYRDTRILGQINSHSASLTHDVLAEWRIKDKNIYLPLITHGTVLTRPGYFESPSDNNATHRPAIVNLPIYSNRRGKRTAHSCVIRINVFFFFFFFLPITHKLLPLKRRECEFAPRMETETATAVSAKATEPRIN